MFALKAKRIVLLTMLLSCVSGCAHAEVTDDELQSMTIDELLILQNKIDQTLEEKGYVVYYDILHGDKGENVVKLQERLMNLGYYTGARNGKYDSETQKAIKQFQKDNQLEASGKATIETQVLLYSDELKTTPTPKPKVTATPAFVDTDYSEYGKLDYAEAARYPEKYIDSKVVLNGRVVQVIGDKISGFTLRVSLIGSSSDIVYVKVPKGLDFNILENDRLTIYAVMTGTKTYTSVLGQSITLPSATAEKVILN